MMGVAGERSPVVSTNIPHKLVLREEECPEYIEYGRLVMCSL